MEKVYFGLIMRTTNRGLDLRDIAARLFLCISLSCENVVNMVEMIMTGGFQVDRFYRKTQESIDKLVDMISDSDMLSEVMLERISHWERIIGKPTYEDYNYLASEYGFTYEMLFGSDAGSRKRFSSAKDLSEYVKRFVKGQDEVIDMLSVSFYQHLESYRNRSTCTVKTPVMLIGQTGVGKSEIYRIMARCCECPIIRINTTEITPNGWKGQGLEDILARHVKDDITIEDMEYAILVFHEFDKITHHGVNISGEKGTDMDLDMQRTVMRLFEKDHPLTISDSSSCMSAVNYELKTENLLIVFDGAFGGIEELIANRLKKGNAVGFNRREVTIKNEEYIRKNLVMDDLVAWGFLPELLGRIGMICVMNPLTPETIYQIMTDADENILKDHINYCRNYNIQLNFSENALRYIADQAFRSGLGFRNVKTLLSRALNDFYFNIEKAEGDKPKVVNIDEQYVSNKISRI